MTGEIQIPFAWRIIVEGDASPKRFHVLTALPEHPHTFGFDAGAKRDLLDAVASAAAAHKLDTFHVLWEITPAMCAQCFSHPDAGTMTAGCIPSLYISSSRSCRP
jgi:hypothetical protein